MEMLAWPAAPLPPPGHAESIGSHRGNPPILFAALAPAPHKPTSHHPRARVPPLPTYKGETQWIMERRAES